MFSVAQRCGRHCGGDRREEGITEQYWCRNNLPKPANSHTLKIYIPFNSFRDVAALGPRRPRPTFACGAYQPHKHHIYYALTIHISLNPLIKAKKFRRCAGIKDMKAYYNPPSLVMYVMRKYSRVQPSHIRFMLECLTSSLYSTSIE